MAVSGIFQSGYGYDYDDDCWYKKYSHYDDCYYYKKHYHHYKHYKHRKHYKKDYDC